MVVSCWSFVKIYLYVINIIVYLIFMGVYLDCFLCLLELFSLIFVSDFLKFRSDLFTSLSKQVFMRLTLGFSQKVPWVIRPILYIYLHLFWLLTVLYRLLLRIPPSPKRWSVFRNKTSMSVMSSHHSHARSPRHIWCRTPGRVVDLKRYRVLDSY